MPKSSQADRPQGGLPGAPEAQADVQVVADAVQEELAAGGEAESARASKRPEASPSSPNHDASPRAPHLALGPLTW